MFDESISKEKDLIRINVIGDLDIYSEKAFVDFTKSYIEEDKDLIFDFKDLDYIDSTGLGLFMKLYKKQDKKGKSIKIINAKDNVYKLFKITDLIEIFNMEIWWIR